MGALNDVTRQPCGLTPVKTRRIVPSLPEASSPWRTRRTLRRSLGVEPRLQRREFLEQRSELGVGILLCPAGRACRADRAARDPRRIRERRRAYPASPHHLPTSNYQDRNPSARGTGPRLGANAVNDQREVHVRFKRVPLLILLVLILASLAAAISAQGAGQSVGHEDDVIVIGHRGASGVAAGAHPRQLCARHRPGGGLHRARLRRDQRWRPGGAAQERPDRDDRCSGAPGVRAGARSCSTGQSSAAGTRRTSRSPS